MEVENGYLTSLKARNYEMYQYFKRGLEIISILKSKMFEAYIVGGAVRDFILKIDFNDIDIATNATPEEVIEIFKDLKVDDRYASLGSVVIQEAGFNFEITTFRNEEYVKYKIKDVHYSKKLVEDIIRRDFTVNALALTPNMTIVDLVEGQKDLSKGLVRVIGSGKRRFRDDPSRMLRGLRLVSKYNFTIESNTEKAMRKCRNYLKEVSELKLLSEIEKILNEKYALKALKIIDSNNLLRVLPKHAYWISLIIKHYKKLSLMEKYTLLYLITGDLPKNIEANHEKAKEVKKLYSIAQNLLVNNVDQMMIFTTGVDLLLAADRICKAYMSKYRRKKSLIKKLARKMKIKTLNDLNYSAKELTAMMRPEQLPKTSQIMDEIIYNVMIGKLPNETSEIASFARTLLNNGNIYSEVKTNNGFKDRNNDRYFDDKKEEYKLYEKVYDSYEVNEVEDDYDYDEIPIDESYYEYLASQLDDESYNIPTHPTTNYSDARLAALKKEYEEDFLNIYKIYIKGIAGYFDMSPAEQQLKINEVKKQTKEFLIKNNPKYRILSERGII